MGSCKYSCTLRAGRARTVGGLCTTLAVAAFAWAGAVAPSVAAGAEACRGETLLPTATDTAIVDRATLCLINRVRSANRLRPLRANHWLLSVAASQVTSMVSRDYFADVRPSGQTPLALVGVTRYPAHAAGIAVGQNIAWGTGSYATPQHIVSEWMASPPHRAVILTASYRDAGAAVTAAVPGVVAASHSGATYAMEFGVRRF